jgi:DHA1 family bicyclomycin/chloramphenicol resistance-like MFS transporter
MPVKSAKSVMSSTTVVFVLTLLLGIQPVTTDLYLPALPAIAEGFGASVAQAQFTLSALLLSFGISQLIWGPLSDRFGRKPILLVGLGLYTVAAVGAAWADSIQLLITWRIFQGLAMGAVVMCGRALVRDLYAPVEGVKVMSKGLSGLGLLACLSAPLGSVLAANYGARATLLAVAAFGLFALLMTVLKFQETLVNKNKDALQWLQLLKTWVQIMKHPVFLSFSAVSSASFCVLFVFLSTSSFVFIKHFGFSVQAYGFVMLGMSTHYLAGTFICRRLMARVGMAKTMKIAGLMTLIGGGLLVGLSLAGVNHPAAVLVPFFIISVAHGIHQPCGQTGAIAPFGHAAGTASALNGFVMMVFAFLTSMLLGYLQTAMPLGGVLPLVYVMSLWAVTLAIIAWTVVQTYALK